MSVLLRQHFWKTKMCPLYLENRCKEGDNCDYAHSVEDLRTIPDLRRTKLCHKLLKGDKCFNKKCNYAHTQEELKSAQNLFAYKSSMCKFIGTNNCLNGSTCRFAHFVEELRVPRAPEILLEQNNSQMDIHNCTDINNATNNNNNNNNNHMNTTVTTGNNNHNVNKEGDMNHMESHHNINMQPSEIDMLRNCDSRNMRNPKMSTQSNFMEKHNGTARGGRKERRDTKYRNKPKDKTNKSRMNPYYQMDPAYVARESTEAYAEYALCGKQRMNSNTTNYDNVNYNMDLMKYQQDQTEITYEDVQMPQYYEQKESIKRNDSMKIQKESTKINEMNKEKCEEDSLDKTYRSVDNKNITDLEEDEEEHEQEEQKRQYEHVDNYNNMYYNINLMNQRSQLNHMNPVSQSINENIPAYPLYQQYPMPMQYAYPYMIPYYNNNNNNNDINNPLMNKVYAHDNPLAYVAAAQMPNPMYYYYYPYCNGVQANQFNVNSHSQAVLPSVSPMVPMQVNSKTNEENNKREGIEENHEKRMNSAQSIEYETKDMKENMTEKSCENSSLGVVEENVTCAFEVYRDQIVYSKLDEKLIEEINKKSKQKEKNTNSPLQKILPQSVQLKLNSNDSENDMKEEKIKSNMILCSENKDDKECKENKLTNSTHHANDQSTTTTTNNNNNNTRGNAESTLKKKKGATPCSIYSYISNADMNNGKGYKNETPFALPIPLASASMIPNNMNHPMNYNMNVPMNNYNMYNPNNAASSPYYFGSPYMYNTDQVYKY